MTRKSNHRFGAAAAVAVLVLGASGCGSSGGSAGHANSKRSSGGARAEKAVQQTVTKAPFCSKLDAAKIHDALRATVPITLTKQLKPGQKYTYFKGAPPSISHYWECDFSQRKITHPFFTFSAGMSGGMPYDKERYDGEVKARRDSEVRDKKVTCEPLAHDDTLAAGGSRVVCHRAEEKSATSFSAGYTTVTLYGLVDDTKLVCGVSSSDDKGVDTMKSAAASLCADFHDAVTE